MNKRTYAIFGGIAAAVAIIIVISLLVFTTRTNNATTIQPADESISSSANIRVGYVDLASAMPIFVAQEKNSFEKRAIKAEFLLFRTGDQLLEASVSGQIDVSLPSSSTVLFAAEARSPGSSKIVEVSPLSSANPGTYILIRNGSSISEPSELAGKKVGIFPSSTAKVLSELAFEKMLGSRESVSLIQISPLDWAQSLATGSVDAILAYEPFGTIIVAEGIGKVLVTEPFGTYVMESLPLPVVTFSSNFVENNPDAAIRFKQAFDEALDFARSNEDESKRIFMEHSDIVNEKTFELIRIPGWKTVDDDDIRRLQQFADLLFDQKLVEKRIEVSNMIYQGPLRAQQ